MAPLRSELVTWALCATAAGLGVWVFVIDRGTPTTHEVSARAGMLLRVWRPDDVTRVTVRRAGETLELLRDGEQWKMNVPRRGRADFLAVTTLLNAIGGARAERAVGGASEGDRKAFGLDPPHTTVEVAMKGIELKLALGAPEVQSGGDSAEGGAYLEVAPYGDAPGGVYVVPIEFVRALDRAADAYRDPSLLASRQSPGFRRLVVRTHDGGGVTLERAEHGTWRIPSGPSGPSREERAPVRADADAVNGLFAVFADLKADPFVDDATPVDESKGGAVDVDLRDGGKLAFAFGGACPTNPKLAVVQLRLPEKSTGCVPTVLLDRLARAAPQYVDTHPFALLFGTENAKVSEIEAVTIEHQGKKVIDVERRGDGLHSRGQDDEQIGREASERFLHRLATLHGDVTAPPETPPAFVGRVTLLRRVDPLTSGVPAGDGGGEPWAQVVEVSSPMEDATSRRAVVWLRRADDGATLRLDAEDAVPLRPGAARELRNANLLDVASDAIVRVTTHPSPPLAAVPFDLQRTAGVYRLVSPPLGADPTSSGEITLQLATLTCTRWAAEKDDGSFGFASPSATIDVQRDPAKSPGATSTLLTVELGAPTADGGVYARVKGRDPVCVLPESKRDAVLRVPVDRAAIGFDPTAAPRIVVSRPGATGASGATRTLVFDDPSKTWRDGDVTAGKLADLVVGLRAEALLHLGPAGRDEGFDKPTLVMESYYAGARKKRVKVGALGKLDRSTIYFVRVDGVDATFAALRGEVDKIVTLL